MYLRSFVFQIGVKSTEEVIQRIRSDLIPRLSTQPGFFAYYVVALSENRVATIRIFEDQDSLESAHEATVGALDAIVKEFNITDGIVEESGYDGDVSAGVAYARLFL